LLLEILVAIETVSLVVGLPLLALYLRERVRNLAREQTEKALADYRHQHERALAAINASHERAVHEFSLYAKKQHAVYGALYRRIRIAADAYSSFYGFFSSPDFSLYRTEEIQEYCQQNRLREKDVDAALKAAVQNDGSAVRVAMEQLDHKVKVRNADSAFATAKNLEALNELYLSDEIRRVMNSVRHSLAVMSAAIRRDPDDRDMRGLEKKEELEESVRNLYQVMRAELKRGASNGDPIMVSTPAS
jgi:hypothetical protein